MFDPNKVPEADLRRYDLNVVAHWQAITAQRNKLEGHELQMKYFQYLSLLFTELYLDWYFNHLQDLLDGLNEEMTRYRAETGAEPFRDFEADDLNKIAFWNATGSGKTLLLHVNIRQYLHYFQAGRSDHYPSKIVLLTPNEGLSRQHLEELHLSGFGFSQFFNKAQSPARGTIEIIDINKLGDDMGDKTVAVDAFEGNNLVLVDEGHRGTGTAAGAWMARREALVRGGFAFEYSATFGQAVAKGMIVTAAEEDIQKKRAKMLFNTTSLRSLDDGQKAQLALTAEDKRRARITATREIYAKCILFDYSYKFFYEDGYGKESLILNMNGEAYEQADNARKYFTACLLAYYQQLWLWSTHRSALADFNIEKPLWVFVGNTVSGEESDILEVVNFLADFLNSEAQIKSWLTDLIADKAQILDAKGNNIFSGRFTPLMGFGSRVDELYADILLRVFNASARQRLKLVNIKSSKGELALRVGDAEPFGLINIGEASKWNAPHMVAISFDRHLFYPLFGFESDGDKKSVPLKLTPLGLGAPSEVEFVRDLEAFYNSPDGKQAIGARSLYLLRNAASEDKGLGFALAGNFYPDFLLWLVDDASGQQWLTFVDPKGLLHIDLNHPKLSLYKGVKTLEADLAKPGEPPLVLNAFILSPTKFASLLNHGNTKAELEDRHVLFMEDGGSTYLKKMFAVLA